MCVCKTQWPNRLLAPEDNRDILKTLWNVSIIYTLDTICMAQEVLQIFFHEIPYGLNALVYKGEWVSQMFIVIQVIYIV